MAKAAPPVAAAPVVTAGRDPVLPRPTAQGPEAARVRRWCAFGPRLGRTRGPRCGGLAERTRGLKVPAGRAPLADWSPSEAAAPSQAFLSFPPQVPRPAQLKSTSPGSPAPKRRLTLFPSPRETCEGWDGRLDATSLALFLGLQNRVLPPDLLPPPRQGFLPRSVCAEGVLEQGRERRGSGFSGRLWPLAFPRGPPAAGAQIRALRSSVNKRASL